MGSPNLGDFFSGLNSRSDGRGGIFTSSALGSCCAHEGPCERPRTADTHTRTGQRRRAGHTTRRTDRRRYSQIFWSLFSVSGVSHVDSAYDRPHHFTRYISGGGATGAPFLNGSAKPFTVRTDWTPAPSMRKWLAGSSSPAALAASAAASGSAPVRPTSTAWA